jgi:hypothetical protein
MTLSPEGASDFHRLASASRLHLIEKEDFEIGAESDLAFVGLHPSGKELQQRGLASAVRADDADAVAAKDAGGEIPQDAARAFRSDKRFRDAFGLDNQPSARHGVGRGKLDAALRADPLSALAP